MADARTQVRLQDIVDEIEGIRSVTMGLSFADFDRSWSTLRATQHALLIISEAVKNLPDDLKARRPDVPWRRIQALGTSCAMSTRRATTSAFGASSSTTCQRSARPYAPCLRKRARGRDARQRHAAARHHSGFAKGRR
jgi:uncharacterized protein with HEPN domain